MDKVPTNLRLTYAAFRAFIAACDERYEFVAGAAVAMGIPSDEHQRLSKLLIRRLDEHFRTAPWEALPSVALWTGDNERVPDILVLSQSVEGREARLVIEIMDDGRGDDLGSKLTEYQALLTIQQYLVLEAKRRWVRCWTRNLEGSFVAERDYTAGYVTIDSIGYELDVDQLYRDAGL